jgi:hypothetical protein
VVVVGGGAVGQVLGHALDRGGAEVSFLVKPAHLAAAQRGFVLWRRARGKTPFPSLLDAPVATAVGQVPDVIVLAVPATALDPAWLDELAAVTGDATAVVVAPGGAATVRAAFGARTVPAAIGFLAWSTKHGTSYWLPPLARVPLSGERARVRALVRVLRRGGLPAAPHRDAARFAEAGAAVLEPLAAALPGSPTLRAIARGLSRFAPVDLEKFFARHYTKLEPQSRRLLATLAPDTARRLAAMRVNEIDPARPSAVKRNVHAIDIAADPDELAAALAAVLAEPGHRFGDVTVRRPAARVGQPFEVGDRFMGCFPLPGLADHAVITEVAPRRVVYRYLEGTPLAGESAYTIAPIPGGCRLEVAFTWQELSTPALLFLHRFGLGAHDRAVLAQAEAAAAHLGARVVASTLSR